jgi:hypothetical protein
MAVRKRGVGHLVAVRVDQAVVVDGAVGEVEPGREQLLVERFVDRAGGAGGEDVVGLRERSRRGSSGGESRTKKGSLYYQASTAARIQVRQLARAPRS